MSYHYNFQQAIERLTVDHGIEATLLCQLDTWVHTFLRVLTQTFQVLLDNNHTKTLKSSHIKHAVRILCVGDLRTHLLSFEHSSPSSPRRLLVEPSVIEDCIQSHLPKWTRIQAPCAPFVSACLAYLVYELLRVASARAEIHGVSTLNVKHVVEGIRGDYELQELFKACKCSFGELGMRLKDPYFILPKHPFDAVVREIIEWERGEHAEPVKITRKALLNLQKITEDTLTDILFTANQLCSHAGRSRLIASDIELAMQLRGQ